MSATGAAADLMPAVVAPGRTIVDETGERVGPGGFAKIKRSEFKSLRDEGFVVGMPKERRVDSKVTGPTVTVAAGPSVKRVP